MSLVDDNAYSSLIHSALPSQLEEGIYLARNGDVETARSIFRRIIHRSPESEDAWLWLAWVAESPQESLDFLREACVLLPQSTRLAEAARWAKEEVGGAEGLAEEPRWKAPTDQAMRVAVQRPLRGATRAAGAVLSGADRVWSRLEGVPARVGALGGGRVGRAMARLGVPVVAGFAIVALLFFGALGIRSTLGMGRVYAVEPLVLPTPLAEFDAATSLEQQTDPLWAQADAAWGQGDLDGVISWLEEIRSVNPQDAEARRRLAAARHQRGLLLVQENQLEEARTEYDAAIRLDAHNPEVQQARRELKMYLDGLQAYYLQDWGRVVYSLRRLYQLNPGFRDTREMLAQGYYGVGLEYQANREWDQAKASLESAVELKPDYADAQTRLGQVMDEIFPPRRVEVSLESMTVSVFENHVPIKTFEACIGRPSAPTLPGHYQIQSKLPMAYASKWDLDMPCSENGFHALPIIKSSGQTVWRSALSTRCSFGCIVLDTEDAQFLYNWVDIGTVVIIY